MGTPRFASEILLNLLEEGIKIDCVFTQPDKAIGRKSKLLASPVKEIAKKQGIEVIQYEKLNATAINLLRSKQPDLIIVAAYGIILPKEILDIPLFGCINVHASVLPEFRGSSPIHNALKNGRGKTGVSIMLMDEGVDTGKIFSQKSIVIPRDITYLGLEDELIKISNQLLIPTLEKIVKKELTSTPQNNEQSSSTRMIRKEDGKILWQNQNAEDIFNLYRAFNVWPKVCAFWKQADLDKRVTLTFKDYDSKNYSMEVGQVFERDKEVLIQTIQGALLLKTVQLEGKNEISAKDFVNGRPTFIKTILK
ncbi:methionyl-tRNA formyltransferase [bacterium]|nr:methionyl-tRNA formyltransferase [bacterium]MBT4598059.1 methionyl-tRNA formyltransferase [bacterium]MBT6753402.1 methionyl-tRNA formyltransferase [bacterium]MBT7038115.1 methionyl-tRNA formyltransferase [bacterium]MBT7431651.1 methionyl-tRNA formyltransferase [bacterium]